MDGVAREFKWGDDFLMFGSELEPNVSVEASVVFVGYGVKTPDGTYNDYAGVDAKGKIVAEWFDGPPTLATELRAHLASGREKLRTARDQGAIGVVVHWSPEVERALQWVRFVRFAGFPGMRWLGPDGQLSDSFPELRVGAALSQIAAERLFQHAPKSWPDVLRDSRDSKPQGFPLPVTMRLHEASRFRENSSPNVAAVLPGADPKLKSEYVVYTAHSDHLGIGAPVKGDTIYNGASDDASGVAALLTIAQALQALPRPPARSILFLAVTAEESGLLGSDYYAHFPTVPIQDIAANVNIDRASMFFYTFKDVVALGAPDSTLGRVVERVASRLGLKVSADPAPEQHSFIRSDQYSFVRQGVPSLYIREGYEAKDPKIDAKKFTEQWIATRYHTPSDDMSQPMNLDAAVQFMQLHFLVGYDIANDPQRPRWNAGDFFGEMFGRK